MNTIEMLQQRFGAAETGLQGNGDAALDQADFLELMIAQLRAQDPTSPTDTSEYFGQLAQISIVTGIQEMKQAFQEVGAALGGNQTLQAAALVDRNVLVPSQTGYLPPEEGSMGAAAQLDLDSTQVTFKVIDESGAVVRTVNVGSQSAGLVNFEWDGFDESGSRAPEGNYRIEATALFDGTPQALQTFAEGHVSSVTLSGLTGGTLVELEGLGQFDLTEVIRIG